MTIRFRFKGTLVEAELDDTPAARDFASLLPLTLTLEDYAATEKIGYLPRKLDVKGEPASAAGRPRVVAYYAPWGNLALFHKAGPRAPGLVRLGRITRGLEALIETGTADVTIESVGDVAD